MERAFIIWGIIISITAVAAADLTIPVSASHNAVSGLIFLSENPSGTNINPAFIYPGAEAGGSYLYNLADLPYYTLHLSTLSGQWGFYLGGSHLAHPLYQETVSNLSFNLRRELYAFGISFRMLQTQIRNFDTARAFALDSGFIVYYDSFTLGFSLRNVSQTRFQGQFLPIVVHWEVNHSLSRNSSLSVGIEKEKGYDFTLKFGAFHRLYPQLALLAGYQYEPDRIGAGIILLPAPLQVTYSFLTHRYLAPTHFISLTYSFDKVVSE
jgi:hypothetical protein